MAMIPSLLRSFPEILAETRQNAAPLSEASLSLARAAFRCRRFKHPLAGLLHQTANSCKFLAATSLPVQALVQPLVAMIGVIVGSAHETEIKAR
jgi:hypothetical protein